MLLCNRQSEFRVIDVSATKHGKLIILAVESDCFNLLINFYLLVQIVSWNGLLQLNPRIVEIILQYSSTHLVTEIPLT